MKIKHNNKLFISHASADKYFVRPLVKEFEKHGIDVWYDETTLKVGDSVRREIEKALISCPYGLVVLSKNFFAKEWPQRELDGLTHNELSSKRKIILPVWLDISAEEVSSYSPSLADKIGLRSVDGIPSIVSAVLDVITVADDKTVLIRRRNPAEFDLEDIIYSYEHKELLSGTILYSRYTIKNILSMSGFSIVYVAWDEMRDSDVVIKEFFPSDFCTRDIAGNVVPNTKKNEPTIEYLKREITQAIKTEFRISKKVSGVAVDAFRENGTIYSVYEKIEGKVLSGILSQEGSLDFLEVIRFIPDILLALNEVHRMGVVHRDLKPNNIMMTDQGRAVILDWGISVSFEAQTKSIFSTIVTPGYSPPEQYESDAELTPAVDIYAIGATLYEVLTGIKPQDSISRLQNDYLVPIDELIDIRIPAADAVMRSLSLDRSLRQKSTLEFLYQLQGEAGLHKRSSKKPID